MIPAEKTLRRALMANALFSAFTAAECLFMSTSVGEFTGIPRQEILFLGVNLAVFAAALVLLLRQDLSRGWARAAVGVVIALDALWVVGSLAVLLMPTPLTTAGQWTVGLVAFAVGEIAFFQWRGWRGLGRAVNSSSAAVNEPALGQPL